MRSHIKDLAELALNGLRSRIKEKLEGYEFLTINQVLQRALAQESRSKESKFKSDHLGMHMLHGDSSDDENSEVYALNLYGHLAINLALVPL